MPRLFIVMPLVVPVMAQAHPGHFAEVAGHGHWLAAGALAAAAALALLLAKGRKAKQEEAKPEAEETIDDEELQEA